MHNKVSAATIYNKMALDNENAEREIEHWTLDPWSKCMSKPNLKKIKIRPYNSVQMSI